METYGLYINGEWTESVTGQRFKSNDPATGETLATMAQGAEADVLKAIDAAEKAFLILEAHASPHKGRDSAQSRGYHEGTQSGIRRLRDAGDGQNHC